MTLPAIEKMIETLINEANPANETLIEFYERKRIELIEEINCTIYEKLKGAYAS